MLSKDSERAPVTFKTFDFQGIWKYFPLKRPLKERLKHILFTCFPFYFKDWTVYQNWKFAKVFFNKSSRFWHKAYWVRVLSNEYRIPISLGLPDPNLEECFPALTVVIHAFYPDIFEEILIKLDTPDHQIAILYITTTPSNQEIIEGIVQQFPFKYKLVLVTNRGRDILPFLKILPELVDGGHQFILKLHTKRSNHLGRKDHWREDLFEKLISKSAVNKYLNTLADHSSLGMIGPAGNILSMGLYYGANAERVHRLSKAMYVSDDQLMDLNFVAGSMFYVKTKALIPLLQLKLTEQDFEEEDDQKDGTMAHVVERLFSVSTILSGMQIADSHLDVSEPYYTVSKVHHFIR
jgi:lipopolysaccharide biosynthesis protein